MSAQSQIFNPTLRTSQASGDGFSCPVMNTASRLTLNFGVSDKGMMVYDTTISNVMYWTGTVWLPLGGGVVPVGASLNTEVIYNNAGFLEGDAGLTFNNATNALTIAGPATVQGLTLGKGGGSIASNTAFGNSALAAVTTATLSTAIGNLALDALTIGDGNTAIGSAALGSCTTGGYNTAVGLNANNGVTTGTENTCVGIQSLFQATSSYTTAIGARTLQALVSGNENTAIGALAGANQTIGTNNGFFGAGATGDSNIASNSYNYGDAGVTSHKFRAGNVVVGTGNVVMSTSGRGIDFSATAGAGTSELFHDYEEGTWTPTDVSGAGLAITGSNCLYTKIGRIVTIEGLISFPANASAATAAIGGLPFNNANILGLNPQYGSEATLAFLYGGPTSTIALYTVAQTLITNATMSNDTFMISGTYTAVT